MLSLKDFTRFLKIISCFRVYWKQREVIEWHKRKKMNWIDLSCWMTWVTGPVFFRQGQYKNGFSLKIALSDDRAGMIFCNFSANSQAHSCSVVSIFWIEFFERFEGFFYAYPVVFNWNLQLVIQVLWLFILIRGGVSFLQNFNVFEIRWWKSKWMYLGFP